MSSHLNQSLARVAHAGEKLSKQPTGNNLNNYNKAFLLNELIQETKDMLLHAVDTLEANDLDVSYTKASINALDEDQEIKDIIENLQKEDTSDEDSMLRFYQSGSQ